MRYEVHHDALAEDAAAFESGATGVLDAAAAAPSSVDAGPMGPVIAAVLSILIETAGALVDAFDEPAGSIRAASTFYVADDQASAARFDQLAGGR